MTALVVVAKEPVPGRVKTRLHPPFSLADAARIAAACLVDTLDAVADLPATRRILLIDGRGPGRPGWQEWPQPSGNLDERIAWCLDELTGPMLLIGMDTPHLDATVLAPAFDWPEDVDAFLGPAEDGGYWALGLRRPDGALVRGCRCRVTTPARSSCAGWPTPACGSARCRRCATSTPSPTWPARRVEPRAWPRC